MSLHQRWYLRPKLHAIGQRDMRGPEHELNNERHSHEWQTYDWIEYLFVAFIVKHVHLAVNTLDLSHTCVLTHIFRLQFLQYFLHVLNAAVFNWRSCQYLWLAIDNTNGILPVRQTGLPTNCMKQWFCMKWIMVWIGNSNMVVRGVDQTAPVMGSK